MREFPATGFFCLDWQKRYFYIFSGAGMPQNLSSPGLAASIGQVE
jgi:hypothetical protein